MWLALSESTSPRSIFGVAMMKSLNLNLALTLKIDSLTLCVKNLQTFLAFFGPELLFVDTGSVGAKSRIWRNSVTHDLTGQKI